MSKASAVTCIAVSVMSFSSLTLLAGPLSKSQLPATAKWVMHIDVERLAASQACAILTNNPAIGKAFTAQLARYRALLGGNPLTDLRNVTLFGEDTTGNRGVALVAGNIRPESVTRVISGYSQYRAVRWDKWTLHKWRDAASGTEMNACFHSPRLLIIGSDESGVTGALNVLGGAKPSLAKGKGLLAVPAPRDGVFLTAATRGYAGSDDEPFRAMILRNTDSATVQIGETAGKVDAAMVLNAVSPDAALQIEQILNGLIVTASLSNDKTGLAQLAAMSSVDRADRSVSLHLNCPSYQAAVLLANALFPPSR